ncbi:MAG: hypothetical protein ACI90E_000259 [Yoonia sp.]|jgi:hypothetical protein
MLLIKMLSIKHAHLGGSKSILMRSSPRLVKSEVVLLLGEVYGLAKMHLVSVHAAFRVSAWLKYGVSRVRLSRAV